MEIFYVIGGIMVIVLGGFAMAVLFDPHNTNSRGEGNFLPKAMLTLIPILGIFMVMRGGELMEITQQPERLKYSAKVCTGLYDNATDSLSVWVYYNSKVSGMSCEEAVKRINLNYPDYAKTLVPTQPSITVQIAP